MSQCIPEFRATYTSVEPKPEANVFQLILIVTAPIVHAVGAFFICTTGPTACDIRGDPPGLVARHQQFSRDPAGFRGESSKPVPAGRLIGVCRQQRVACFHPFGESFTPIIVSCLGIASPSLIFGHLGISNA
jgi:hypothetical protein